MDITKITKIDWDSKQNINIENYLKQKINKDNMEEIDIKICRKKTNKD